uniref:Pecanex-like protein n=1 Tax=Angiostrongylus cantonensis TaxID=6313 RepID=A0A0K0CVQ1_ANGCA
LVSHSRRTSVDLLNGECLKMFVTSRLSVDEVLLLAAHHCRIFEIAFFDDHSHHHWLQGGEKLLDYKFPSSKAIIRSMYNIRSFVDSIFFRGSYISLKNHLWLLASFIPRFLSHHDLDQDFLSRQALTEYSALCDVQHRSAIISLMRIVEKCSKYGRRLSCSGCVLSINSLGIQNFLDNLYYKNHIFSIEARDPRSKQIFGFNVSTASVLRGDDLSLSTLSCVGRVIWTTAIAHDRLNRLIRESSIGSCSPTLSSLHSITSLSTMPAAKVRDELHSNRPTLAVVRSTANYWTQDFASYITMSMSQNVHRIVYVGQNANEPSSF